ncbi:MAG: TRAP transporter small permease [Oscillospiraceae bacterium]|nr:TRAP transporter small permease [Oscillospiraceae bacterium]
MKRTMDKITTVTDAVCTIFAYISMAMIIILMLMVCLDVVLGNIFKSPIPGMYEICQLMLSMVVFTSWAYTQTVHGHIHVTMFVSKMPQKLRFFCFSLTSFIATAVLGIGTYAVYKQILVKKLSGEATGTLQLPFWPFYIFELVAFGLLTILLLRDAIKAAMAMFDKEMADEIQATW